MSKNKQKIRDKFKSDVFKRDNYSCVECESKFSKETSDENLDAHHITDRNEIVNGGYVVENGISLCKDKCHMRAEKFHITSGKEWEDGMHPDDLYKKIGSSKELAIEKSLKL